MHNAFYFWLPTAGQQSLDLPTGNITSVPLDSHGNATVSGESKAVTGADGG